MVTEEVRTWSSKLYYKISNKRTAPSNVKILASAFDGIGLITRLLNHGQYMYRVVFLEQHMLSTIT
jgi:hypothetical protein